MSEVTTEARDGFTIYTVTLETGEELKYPSINLDDLENLTAGFQDDLAALSKEYREAETDQEKAQVSNALHWLMVKEALTPLEIKKWRALKQKAFWTAIGLGAEASGTTAKK
jgi:hypothetical protein